MGLPIPMNFNPCDHYIHHIALVPGMEEESYKKMDKICYAFSNSKISRKNARKSKEREAYRQSISTNVLPPKPKPAFGITLFWLLWRAFISHVSFIKKSFWLKKYFWPKWNFQFGGNVSPKNKFVLS
mgnify:CR=1 FL=1